MRTISKQELKEISEMENKIDNVKSQDDWSNDDNNLDLIDKYERELILINAKYNKSKFQDDYDFDRGYLPE